ncbi:MAG: beta-ketoacyl synthase N-terminal-like domain-containing protein [Halobacteriaceae archaeon]
MHQVRVAGTGLTPFGRHPDTPSRALFGEAGGAAVDDAGLAPGDVDAVYLGNYMGAVAESQGHMAPLAAEAVGTTAPATRYEDACASAGVAARAAVQDVRCGAVDVALVGGVERMTHLDTPAATAGLAAAADDRHEVSAGLTFPGAYALMADAYFDRFDADRRDLAHVAVKNHRHGADNPYAQFQREITVEEALDAPMIADPLGLYDACPFSDGAAALVLASDAAVDERGLDAPVAITGSGQGGDTLALQDRASLTETPATAAAARDAFEEAGVGPDDVDVAEVHDCFTVAEALALEALGFYEPGEAAGAARRGETARGGRIPTNLSGGLKAKGHPVGATGAGQLVDLVKVLTGVRDAGAGAGGARVGLAHNAGGSVASAVVHVLEVVA